MNFLNPLVLFGLAASSIPILIHLLNLQRKKKVEFSTLKFLKELQDNKIRKLKIRQWLLLLLRTLLITFIVLAFARPTIESKIPGLVSYSNTNAAIILDNSYSMNISDQFGNRFRRAKNITGDILNTLEPGDMAEAIALLSSKNINSYSLKKNFVELNEGANKFEIYADKPDLSSSIEQVNSLFNENKNLNSEIIIISDAQKNVFDLKDSIKNIDLNAGIKFIKIGEEFEGKNLSIDSINIKSSIFQFGRVAEFDVFVTNRSSDEINGNILSLVYNKERVAQISFDLKPNENGIIPIAAPVNFRGLVKGEIRLEEDLITEDNSFYFGFKIPEKVKIASFGNSKNNFLNIALKNSNNELDRFTVDQLPSVDLKNYDVVYFSNGDFSKQDFQRLFSFIDGGGNAFIFDLPKARKNLNEFLKNTGISTELKELDESAKFTDVDKLHPIFEGVFLSLDNKKIITSPEMFDLNIADGGNTLIRTDYGSFLSEYQVGEGKFLYCAISPDLSSGNLPVNPLFPALLVRSQYYLTSSSESGVMSSLSGKNILTISKKDSPSNNFKIVDPNGNEFQIQAASIPSGSVLIFEELELLGHYEVYNSKNKAVGILSINHDVGESETQFLSPDEISKKLAEILPENTNVEVITDPKLIDKNMIRSSLGTELWKLFVILALLCGIAELFVQKIYKSEV